MKEHLHVHKLRRAVRGRSPATQDNVELINGNISYFMKTGRS